MSVRPRKNLFDDLDPDELPADSEGLSRFSLFAEFNRPSNKLRSDQQLNEDEPAHLKDLADISIDQWTELQENLKYENYWLRDG
jgi:hypothetical protein